MLENRKDRFQHCFRQLTYITFKDKKNTFSGLDCRLFVRSSSSFHIVLLLLFHIGIRIEQICLCQLLQVLSDSVISDCLSSFCLQRLEFALAAFKCMHLSTVTSEILDLGVTYSVEKFAEQNSEACGLCSKAKYRNNCIFFTVIKNLRKHCFYMYITNQVTPFWI